MAKRRIIARFEPREEEHIRSLAIREETTISEALRRVVRRDMGIEGI
jgi:hypothetical protein